MDGWTGIVGPNGSGKSTLLRLVCGELAEPRGGLAPGATGTIVPLPAPGLAAQAYCAQATEAPPVLAEDFALDYNGEAVRLRRVLSIEEDWPWRFDTLSHGERKRLQIAVALWTNPPLLALDEPTNHVDAATRAVLLEALRAYRGCGLLVSHDRELMDALVTQCLFLRDGTGVMRPGTYSEGRAQEQASHESVQRERERAKQALGHLSAEKARRSTEAARADARRSKHRLDPKDKSAKAKIDLAIYTGQDGKAGKRSAALDSRLAAAEQRVAAAFVPKVYDGAFWLDTAPARRAVLLHLAAGSIALAPGGESDSLHQSESSPSPCLSFPALYLENTAHIGLTGANGAGKSTLIRHIVQQLPAETPVLYLPQEVSSHEGGALLAELKTLPQAERGKALSLVARLNSDPDRLLSGEQLSPGELRKLMLARGILSAPQLIIMDEPTNHLDLQSVEALETVLATCPCALLLVSHDKRFIEATCTQRWHIERTGTSSRLVPL